MIQALESLGIPVAKYFRAEIDKACDLVHEEHFASRDKRDGVKGYNLGDVKHISSEQLQEIGHIDLLIGGSPCQELSALAALNFLERPGMCCQHYT